MNSDILYFADDPEDEGSPEEDPFTTEDPPKDIVDESDVKDPFVEVIEEDIDDDKDEEDPFEIDEDEG